MVPFESTAEELLFDCSQFKINSSDLKVRTYQSPTYDIRLLIHEIQSDHLANAFVCWSCAFRQKPKINSFEKKQKRGGRRRDHLKPTSSSVWLFKWNLSRKFFFTTRYNHIALYKQVLTFEFMDESLRCDHSKENSSAIISHGTIFFPQKFGNFHKNRCTVYSDQSVLSLSSHH